MKFHVVIPARFESSRLPGKPLAELAGQPMIAWVAAAASASGAASVTVATDDARVAGAANAVGVDALMTRADHASGSDRVWEAVAALGLADDDIVVNVQGDEPLIAPTVITQVAELVARKLAPVASLAEPIHSHAELLDAAAVKVVLRADGRALYFSRSPIPFDRGAVESANPPNLGLRHLGLYGYRCAALRAFVSFAPSQLERTEGLEQLRLLENGYDILIERALVASPGGVDTEADLERVRALIEARGLRPVLS